MISRARAGESHMSSFVDVDLERAVIADVNTLKTIWIKWMIHTVHTQAARMVPMTELDMSLRVGRGLTYLENDILGVVRL